LLYFEEGGADHGRRKRAEGMNRHVNLPYRKCGGGMGYDTGPSRKIGNYD